MSNEKNSSVGKNSANRLPIVLCLDVSPSMGWTDDNGTSSMDLLNEAVEGLIRELQSDFRIRAAAEIAYVTFSTNIEMDTEFEPIKSIQIPKFTAVEHGGTQMGQAVIRALDKIEKRKQMLEESEIQFLAPFLILVTDGNPEENDNQDMSEKALEQVRKHCDSKVGAKEIIVPFIIGVGDFKNSETLTQYAAGFTKGYIAINGSTEKRREMFKHVFETIVISSSNSVHLNANEAQTIHVIQRSLEDLQQSLSGM